MRIIHITDPHLGEDGEDTFGVDVRANFLHVLTTARQLRPDHLILTGDLCFRHGNANIYSWVKTQLDQFNIPYENISGNHDDPVQLAKSFGLMEKLHANELYFAKTIGGTPMLFLDTTTGDMSMLQRAWLEEQLHKAQQKVIIFMHHPPLQGGVQYMDFNYPLYNRDAVQAILFKHPYPITVFCGHYHAEKTVHQSNVTMHITPSTFYQIDQFTEEFKVDHKRPGFRVIDLEENNFSHTVRYL